MRHMEPRAVRRLVAPSANWIRAGITPRQRAFSATVPFVLPLAAMLLWLASLTRVHLSLMDDLGLISVLPPAFYVAFALLTAGFCLALCRRPLRGVVLLFHVGILIMMLYGTPALVEQTPRFAVTWRHLGLTDYIFHTGNVLPKFNAYFNWPGLFAVSAFFTRIAGLSTLIGLAAWANVFFNLLYLAPLALIYRSATHDARVLWIGLWIFYLANWVGQDYFSPQGFTYFPYLVIAASLLTWFGGSVAHPISLAPVFNRIRQRAPRLASWVEGSARAEASVPTNPWQRVAIMAAVIVMFAAMVPSHQLTPFAAVLCVSALAVLNRIAPRRLPILLLAILVAWSIFMATNYFAGHTESLVSSVGAVHNNVQRGVVHRVKGSSEHQIVVEARLFMTALIVLLALAGVARRVVAGYRDLSMALLAAAPAPLLLAQYGGEMFLRVYFFMLPGLAFFVAVFFVPTPASSPAGQGSPGISQLIARPGPRQWWGRRWATQVRRRLRLPAVSVSWSAVAVGLASLALIVGFMLTRYGNERMDYYTKQEVQAARYLYQIAPPGSVLRAPGISVPWQFEDYTSVRTRWIASRAVRNLDVVSLEQQMSKNPHGGYVFITRSSVATLELYSGLSPDALPRFEQAMLDSGRFQLIYQNADARIYVFVKPPPRAGQR